MSEPISKKSKNSYNNKWKKHQSKRHCLENGLKGFLCTSNFSEKGCVREAYNLLNTYADKLYPPQTVEEFDKNVPPKDILDELDDEIKTINTENKNAVHRFQATDSGAKNCVFIKTTLGDPTELATKIANEILETKEQKTKDLLRLVPIQFVCKATVASVTENISPLLNNYFKNERTTFGIVFNRRFNNTVDKDGLIAEIAKMVVAINPEHKVDLKNPKVTILLEIIKSWCLISVLSEYNKLKKYNLLELSLKKDDNISVLKVETTVTDEVVEN